MKTASLLSRSPLTVALRPLCTALLIAPLLVFVGLAIGQPMDLAFSPFEVVAVALAVAIGSSVVRDAESNWLEGAFLLLVYAMLGVAFFYF